MQTLIDLRVLGVEIGKGEQKSAKAFSAEIKRLADEIEAELAALRAENERLQGTLEEIIRHYGAAEPWLYRLIEKALE